MCFNADIPTYLIQQQHGKNERWHNIKENPFPLGRKREAFYFFSIMSVDGFDLLWISLNAYIQASPLKEKDERELTGGMHESWTPSAMGFLEIVGLAM